MYYRLVLCNTLTLFPANQTSMSQGCTSVQLDMPVSTIVRSGLCTGRNLQSMYNTHPLVHHRECAADTSRAHGRSEQAQDVVGALVLQLAVPDGHHPAGVVHGMQPKPCHAWNGSSFQNASKLGQAWQDAHSAGARQLDGSWTATDKHKLLMWKGCDMRNLEHLGCIRLNIMHYIPFAG